MDKILKEVSLREYSNWYEKLIVETPNERTIKKFNSEIQKWKLYDVTFYHTNERNHPQYIRYYGIPTPLLQTILFHYFKPINDFTKKGLSDLKVTPQDPNFSETILENGIPKKVNERYFEIQIMYLEDWGDFVKIRS